MMSSDDSNIPAEQLTLDGRPQLRADRAGYILDGDYVEGFADRTNIDARSRRALAEWAESYTPNALQDEQKRILAQPDPGPSDTERQLVKGAIENAERDMPLAIDLGLYARLDAEQIRMIREPWTVLGGARRRRIPTEHRRGRPHHRHQCKAGSYLGGKRTSARVPDRRTPALLLRRARVRIPAQRHGPPRDPRRPTHTLRRDKRPDARDRRLRDRALTTHRPARTTGHHVHTPQVVGLRVKLRGNDLNAVSGERPVWRIWS